MSIKDGQCYYSPQEPQNLPMPLFCAQSEWSNQELYFRAPFMEIKVGSCAETVGQHHRQIFPGRSSEN